MHVTVVGSAGAATDFPLRLSLALELPLRFAEAKDSVPCRKLPDFVGSRALDELDLWGAMIVVVRVWLVVGCWNASWLPNKPLSDVGNNRQ